MSINGYLERALFVVGDPISGKSTQIRSMLQDWRFGEGGVRPTRNNLPNIYWINDNRLLYIRLTSPQEYDKDIEGFIKKCEDKLSCGGRANMVCPLQLHGNDNIGDAASVIEHFNDHLQPERVRAVILSPDANGATMDEDSLHPTIDNIRQAGATEVLMVDARSIDENGFIYADFFDFT